MTSRSNLIDKLEGEGKDTTESANLKQVIQIEIDNDKDLKARPFKNSKMREDVISYINLLNDQLDITKKYSNTSSEFTKRWTETYASTSSWAAGGEGAFRSHQFCRRRPGQSDGLELRSGGVILYKG